MPDKNKITVEWLHSIKPPDWTSEKRGISYANWAIHSIQSRPHNVPPPWDGYDIGPFVWTMAPTHGPNMMPLEKPGNRFYVILVLETREDVAKLLELLRREPCNPETEG